MKSEMVRWISAVAVFALVASPLPLASQNKQSHKQPHYQLIDLGTLGGPIGYGSVNGDGFRLLNNSGTVVSFADLPFPDPNQSYFCYDPDCYQGHAFSWKNGVITDLGALPENNNSAASSINSQGWVTGQSQSSLIDPNTGLPEFRAVLWKHHQITDLGTFPGGTESLGVFVNDSDQVVGFSDNDIPDPFSLFPPFATTQIHTFLWKNGEMRDIGTLGGPDAIPGADCAIAPPDQVVGGSYINDNPNPGTGIPTLDPFLWSRGVMTDLGTLGGTIGFAQCVNQHGQIIGNSNLAGDVNAHAFLWQHGTMADLGTLGGDNSVAIWLNQAGEAVGLAQFPGDQIHHPVIWNRGRIHDLGTVDNDPCGIALSVNASGQVVGGTSDCSYFLHAFLWEKNGPMLDLNTLFSSSSGLQVTFALDINDRGEILAKAIPPGVDPHQDPDLYGNLVLLIPCDEKNKSCDDSPSPRFRSVPLDRSTMHDKSRPKQIPQLVPWWRNPFHFSRSVFGQEKLTQQN